MLGNVTKKPQVTAAVFYDCEFTKKNTLGQNVM